MSISETRAPSFGPPASSDQDHDDTDPSAVLTISPSGTIAVATSELFDHMGVHEQLGVLADELLAGLRRIDAMVPTPALAQADVHSAFEAEEAIDRAIAHLEAVTSTCRSVVVALRVSAEANGAAEQATEAGWRALSDLFAYHLGMLAKVAIPSTLLGVGATAAIITALGGWDEVISLAKSVGIDLDAVNRIITSEGVVDGLRDTAMGSDDFLAGFLGVPYPIQQALGDSGLGLVGLATVAGVLRNVTSLVGTPETAPVVKPAKAEEIPAPPSTFTELVNRIPRTEDNGGAQITVDLYTMPDGETRAVVLLAGTVDFTVGSDEPWDMRGNFAAVAADPSTATMAIDEALRQAGVDAATPIQLVGFSQGGAQAAVLAMGGEYNVQGVVAVGAPVGQLAIPESIPVLAVRHTDDLVASAGGGDPGHASNVFEVRNTAFAGAAELPDLPAPAHQFDSYQRTAALMDADRSPELQGAIDQVLAFTRGATSGTSTSYLATRAGE